VFDQRIRKLMDRKKFLVAPPETSVSEAAKMMAKKNAGAVMVLKDKRLIGIFTERDAVIRVLAKGRDARTTELAKVMTPEPRTVAPDETYGHALLIMFENGFRHAPVVENGVPIGIISARNAMDPDLEEFVSEAHRRKHLRQSA